LGDRPLSWRLPSVIFGLLAVAAIYFFATLAFQNQWVGLLSASLFSLDGALFVESRTTKPEIYLLALMILAFWFFWAALRRGDRRLLLAAGAAAGAAAATKWTGLTALGSMVAFLLLRPLWGKQEKLARFAPKDLFMAFLVIPAAVYLASFIPYLTTGRTFSDLYEEHIGMFRYHWQLTAGHPYKSAWWTWPALLRPIWYAWEGNQVMGQGIVLLGNPVLWWAVPPTILLGAIFAWRHRHPAVIFCLLAFLIGFLPFALFPRPLFIYHYLPSLSMGFPLLSFLLVKIWRPSYPLPIFFLLAVMALFFYFYPLYTFAPISLSEYGERMWLPTWR
jgi:dolichyl-phosphate-mannose--protein O-mannosyl transferase